MLAQSSGKGWRVEVLTRAAMEGELDLGDVYSKRLRAVKPTQAQIRSIRQVYKRNVVEDAAEVISVLQEWGHKVYIVSGGLAEPVLEFGLYLGVPRQNIRAVNVQYNELSGPWWNQDQSAEASKRYLYHESSALTVSDGKARIIRELMSGQSGRTLFVGDGVSDLLAARNTDLFVGFGGVVRRSQVAAEAPCYISSPSIAPLLAVAAGPASLQRLAQAGREALLDRIKQLINTGAVNFNNERLGEKFREAYQAIHTGAH